MESQNRPAQPEPWMPRAAALNWPWKPSNEPKCSSIAAAISPSGRSWPSGVRFVQKMEWFV